MAVATLTPLPGQVGGRRCDEAAPCQPGFAAETFTFTVPRDGVAAGEVLGRGRVLQGWRGPTGVGMQPHNPLPVRHGAAIVGTSGCAGGLWRRGVGFGAWHQGWQRGWRSARGVGFGAWRGSAGPWSQEWVPRVTK